MATVADTNGVCRFEAPVLADDSPVIRLLRKLGAHVSPATGSGAGPPGILVAAPVIAFMLLLLS